MNLLNSFHAVLVAAGVVGLLHPWDSFDVFECKDRNWLIQQWTDWMMTWTCRVQEIFPMLHCKLFCKLRNTFFKKVENHESLFTFFLGNEALPLSWRKIFQNYNLSFLLLAFHTNMMFDPYLDLWRKGWMQP